jgi:intracellular sulfur oxidation DsrE/DsrF family protein
MSATAPQSTCRTQFIWRSARGTLGVGTQARTKPGQKRATIRAMLRRDFLSRLTGSAALFRAAQSPAPAPSAPSAADRRFAPARHDVDAWLDQLPGKHRVVFDTFMADHFNLAVGFAGNQFRMNREVYGLTDADIAVVIVARHGTGPYAFNEAMWNKYGKLFAERMSVADKSKPLPPENPHLARLSEMVKQGLHFAVCNLTTRAHARNIAEKTGTDAEAVYKELTSNAIGNAHFVSAGVVAVTRAQEYGYALVTTG